MIHEYTKSVLNERYKNLEHNAVYKGSTIIETLGVIHDFDLIGIAPTVLYARLQTEGDEPTKEFVRFDDSRLVWGKTTVQINDHDIHWSEHEKEVVTDDTYVYSENYCDWFHQDTMRYSDMCNRYFHEDECVWSNYHDDHIHESEAVWNDDVEEYFHENYREDFYEYHDLNDCDNSRDRICDYHEAPSPELVNDDRFSTGWFVGFEVEKTHLDNGADARGDSVEPCNFFAGWETDSSCGVEGISNIYNINDPQLITDIKFASHINSPTDITCGGHVNISYRSSTFSTNIITDDAGTPKKLNVELLKPYMGIIYAMFPQRLIRSYCNTNVKLKNHDGCKYQPLRDCYNRVEIRLFNRVHTSTTLINRVKFLQAALPAIEKLEVQLNRDEILANTSRFPNQEIHDYMKKYHESYYDKVICVDFTYNPHMRYAKYMLNACMPVLMDIYGTDRMQRLSELVVQTYAFTDFLITENKPSPVIQYFLRNL